MVKEAVAGPPPVLHLALEARVAMELALLPQSIPFLSRVAKGDGHPVLLVPGFLSPELPMAAMGKFLQSRGYAVETWGFGRNVGLQRKHLDALEQKVRFLHHRHQRKVSIVGWSLGGTFAMYCAHNAPECVRSIITMGSPINIGPEGAKAAGVANSMYRLVAHPLGPSAHAMQPRLKRLAGPPPVPTTCLYTVSDGIVPQHQATLEGDPKMLENVRVPGSHVGLPLNAVVMWIVANRLAQPEGAWKPFAPKGAMGSAYRWMTHPALPI